MLTLLRLARWPGLARLRSVNRMHGSRSCLQLTLIAPAALLIGCSARIVAPDNPVAPVSVFVLDYGRHASLVLPDGPGGSLIEYAYGDWNWYVMDKSEWYHVFPTLLWPTRGTLGRRKLPADDIHAEVPCEQVLEIVVSGSDVNDLSGELHAHFDEHLASLHFQPLYELHFVHDDSPFHLFHTCNHRLAEWLRRLDCSVRGPILFTDFEVKTPTNLSSGQQK